MTIFIIMVVLIIGYLVYEGKKEDHNHVRSQGGMLEMYSVLVSNLMEGPNSKIEKVHNNTVVISIRPELQRHSFKLFHHMHTLSVEWKALIPFTGELVRRWEFLENVDQDEMTRVITTHINEAMGVDKLLEQIEKERINRLKEENGLNDDLPF